MMVTTSSPGMGAALDELDIEAVGATPADLATVGRVNDLAYGNRDARLERTLRPAGERDPVRVSGGPRRRPGGGGGHGAPSQRGLPP
jgi:hypothetical protein